MCSLHIHLDENSVSLWEQQMNRPVHVVKHILFGYGFYYLTLLRVILPLDVNQTWSLELGVSFEHTHTHACTYTHTNTHTFESLQFVFYPAPEYDSYLTD